MTYQYIIKSVLCAFSPLYARCVIYFSALLHPYIWDINVSHGKEKQWLLSKLLRPWFIHSSNFTLSTVQCLKYTWLSWHSSDLVVTLVAYCIETYVDSRLVLISGLQGLNSVSMNWNPQKSFVLHETQNSAKIIFYNLFHIYLPFFLFAVGNVTRAAAAVVVVVGAGISVSRHICFTSS